MQLRSTDDVPASALRPDLYGWSSCGQEILPFHPSSESRSTMTPCSEASKPHLNQRPNALWSALTKGNPATARKPLHRCVASVSTALPPRFLEWWLPVHRSRCHQLVSLGLTRQKPRLTEIAFPAE